MSIASDILETLDVADRFLKRAQFEAFAFEVTDAGVRVTNHSHETPSEHQYLVEVADGASVACSCPADERFDPACKHRLAVAIREPVMMAAARKTTTAADGESATMCDTAADTNSPVSQPDCDCDEWGGELPCFDCYCAAREE